MKQFSKKAKLKDGTALMMRMLSKEDGPALLEFFSALPKKDRQFLKEDVTNKDVIDRWLNELDHEKAISIIAVKDSVIHGDATIHFNNYGWQRHIAEIRCVVSREYRKQGLGTAMMRELVHFADMRGVSKITAKMMASQKAAQRAFQKLGFKKVAQIKGFVMDIKGKTHNLVIMVNDVGELWRKMEDLHFYSDVRTIR
jgi:RimJ/RimL family protein N-acetyltransferase